MLVPMKDLLLAARQGGYAVPGFNYYHQASVDAIVEEAQLQQSPVILMVASGYIDSLGLELATALGKQAAAKVTTPVALHLDHGGSYEQAEACVNAGFTSVMFDGSKLPYEENVAQTTRVVKMAHARGVSVEAELGAVGGVEDAVYDEESPGKLVLIDPAQAADFVARTGIDCLAPAIGNVHGMTKQEPRLHIPLLQEVSARTAVPLALHGGSGISNETIRAVIKEGITKLNIGTELKIAWRDGLTAFFATGKYEPRLGMQAAKEAIRKIVAKKIALCGSGAKV